ncbi:methyltransferase domain-containing protein [Aquimarina pacifica]|uniref:methyltransferase domain-containing protein n=1 Tax=Aquimarina pacifica TaxID=1296415 RepID=UPI00046ECA1B|nr:methyltransferase domain-containing protein [Aquimarina pacifica]
MLINLDYRSNEAELMDDPAIEEEALKTALSDISRVNRLLGGNRITIRTVVNMIHRIPESKKIVLLDLGCGDGEMIRAIAETCRKNKKNIELIGVDLNNKSLQYAKKLSKGYPEISYQQQDILEMNAATFSCDIIICTLTLHHLTDTGIEKVMKKCTDLATLGVIINDLHRSKLAYYLFKIFSFFFIKGAIAKNDGLISIKRGFKKQELIKYAKNIGVQEYKINWKWAFRYRWVINTQGKTV